MSFLVRIFDLRKSETEVVGMLLLHAFFNGLGIAMCFTASNLLFLQNYGASHFPLAYAISSIFLLLTGFIYSKYEVKVAPSKFFLALLVLCAIIVLANWIGFISINEDMLKVMSFITFVSYWVIYTITNLEFWGVAALLFDVRQSKRLFALIGSGETLAKISGYLLSPILISLFSNESLLLVSGLGFLASAYLIQRLTKKNSDIFKEDEHSEDHHQQDRWVLSELITVVKKDKFLLWTSILAMISVFVYFNIKFAFLGRVEESFQENEKMAAYFGFFFGVGKLANFLLKTLISGRLLKTMGVKRVILILPSALLIISAAGVFSVLFNTSFNLFLWLFGFMMLFDEIARSSLLKPSFLVLFQPLHHHRRLQGHTFAKGIMEPIGMGLAGLILMVLTETLEINLKVVTIYLCITVIIWLLITFKVNKEYIEILQGALKSRWLSGSKLNLQEGKTREYLHKLLYSNDPLEVIYAIELLGTSSVRDLNHFLLKLLDSNHTEIIKKTLQIVREENIKGLSDEIKPFLNHENESIQIEAIKTYGHILEDLSVDELTDKVAVEENEISNAALVSIIKNGGIYGATKFGNNILNLLNSTSDSDRKKAADIIGKISVRNYYRPLISLIESDNLEVKRTAVVAAGKIGNPRIVPHLIAHITTLGLSSVIMRAMEKIGDDIFDYIDLKSLTLEQKRLLIKVSGSIKTHKSRQFALGFIQDDNIYLSKEAVYSLFETSFKARNEDKIIIDEQIRRYFKTFCQLTHLQDYMLKDLSVSAIQNEIILLKTDLIRLFSFFYDRSTLVKIKDTLHHDNDHESQANALERMDLLVEREYKPVVNYLLDKTELTNNYNSLAKQYHFSVDWKQNYLFLLSKASCVSAYTKAIMLHSVEEECIEVVPKEYILKMANSHSRILREEAVRFIVNKNKSLINEIEIFPKYKEHVEKVIEHFN